MAKQNVVTKVTPFGHYVAWSACETCDQTRPPDRLFVDDISSGQIRQVAKSTFAGGTIDWLGGSGDTLVWVDDSRVLSDQIHVQKWKLVAEDLRTSQRWTIADSQGQERSDSPLFEVGSGYVAWTTVDADRRSSDIVVYNLAKRTLGTRLRHIFTSGLDVGQGWLAYTDTGSTTGTQQASANSAANQFVYVVPLKAGKPRKVSTTGDATRPSVGGGLVSWGSPESGDPQRAWIAAPTGGSPRSIYEGGNVDRQLGNGFAALWTTGNLRLLVVPTQGAGRTVSLPGSMFVPARFGVDGQTLAYATYSTDSSGNQLLPLVLHVDRVRVS